jgi:hypothetical protein
VPVANVVPKDLGSGVTELDVVVAAGTTTGTIRSRSLTKQ